MTSSNQKQHLISLGRSIQALREEQGLDPKQLADKAKMRQWRMTAVEEGRCDPDYETLLALADALGISTATLVERAKAIEDEEGDDA
jgi:transcriptional regulator with XRE-family HTH domain